MMTSRLIIIGAGGFAREVYSWAIQHGLQIVAFYEDKIPDKPSRAIYGIPVINDLKPFYGEQFLVAIGDPETRETMWSRGIAMGLDPARPLVHKSVVCGEGVSCEDGSIICPNVTLTCDIHIGRGCIVNIGATVGHDVHLGDFVTVSPGANVSGNVVLGNRAYIGTNAAIREGKSIGDDAVVGMGAVVVKDVPPDTTVVGNPAKIPIPSPKVIPFIIEGPNHE